MSSELEELMNEYTKTNSQIKELKDQKDNIKAKILINLKLNDIDTFETDDTKLTFKQMTRRSLDKERLKIFLEEHKKDISNFETESNFEMLRIVKIGGN